MIEDLCHLDSWGLPPQIVDNYKKRGIVSMFPWQVECLTCDGVLDGQNLVYSAPTSAGKTMVAEILTMQTVLERDKKVLIILPFVSVVREKMLYFQELFEGTNKRVAGFMGSYTPTGGLRSVNVAIATIEKANGLINRLMEEDELQDIGCVVVDELHMLGDSNRGYLLELLLTKIKYMSKIRSNISIQIVGMSATLPNLEMLAKWLDASLYQTDFRPVPLKEYLKIGQNVYNVNNLSLSHIIKPSVEIKKDPDHVIYLCVDTILQGYSILIFCFTKKWCESLALEIASEIKRLGGDNKSKVGIDLRHQLNAKSLGDVLEQLRRCPVGLETDLSKTISFGVAFHHAGLTMDERDIIEGAFKQNIVRVLVATSTLSSGVNLPARRVIVRSPHCHGFPIDILQYRQMIGRAGRMGVDTAGESYLICNENERRMGEEVATHNLPPIKSCLGVGDFSNCLKRALLEVVAGCVVCTTEDAFEYIKCTLLYISTGENFNENLIHQCLKLLTEHQFIRESDNKLAPTNLGQACLAASVTPEIGLKLIKELDKARQNFVLDSELHLLYLITPYSVSEQIGHLDWFRVLNVWEKLPYSMRKVGDMVGIEEGFIVKAMTGTSFSTSSDKHKLAVHRRFYTSLLLNDLINEVSINTVVAKFGTSKGLLQSLQQSSSTFAGMVTQFCKRLGWSSLELLISQFSERLQFGVQRQLVELLRLDCLNSITARTLFNAGIQTIPELALAELRLVQRALSKAIPYQNNENTDDVNDEEERKNIWLAGRFALNAKEAAIYIINEARQLLKRELGLKTACWVENNNNDENDLDTTVDSVKIRPTTSRDVTVIETSQENNKSLESLVKDSPHSSRGDSVDLFSKSDCINSEQVEVLSKDYKRESLDLFDGSFEQTKFSITVNVCSDKLINNSISDSYLAELINIKTPKEPEEKWDCNNGGEGILEMSQRDFGSKKRKREEDLQVEKDKLHDTILEPQPKYKKNDESNVCQPSTSYCQPSTSHYQPSTSLTKSEHGNLFESTMFSDSLRIDTQLDRLLNGHNKSSITNNMISTEMSTSIMQMAFQNTFNLMSNTIISPKICLVDNTCKDLIISDSEDMIAGSQETTSSGPSPRKESPLKPDKNANSIKFDTWAYKTKIIESIESFAREHFSDIRRRKEITIALNLCKETNIEQKIGAKAVRRSLENKNKNVFKFNDQVLKGFAITWHKQIVVQYANFNIVGPSGISLLKKLISNKNLIVNITDAKLNYKIISHFCKIKPVCKFRDPFVADWLINGQHKNSLKNLIQWHLNFQGSVQTNDACFNAFITQKLMTTLRHQLKQIYIYKTFKDIEMPIQVVLAKMEMYGFGLNKDHLVELNNTVNHLMENISQQVLELSGTKFNMHSTVEWARV
ncbi:Hypothetical protein CINCED_3A009416 [Cinara cedri]|nr:Hypothetical protein CINCED_3A009416 [Cinara cedri]